jgi:streptogramin lyase
MNIMGRQAHAAQVGNDDSVIFNQRGTAAIQSLSERSGHSVTSPEPDL